MSNQIKTIYSNMKKPSQLKRLRGCTPTSIFRASINQDVSIFQTFELAPPWPRITLKEHSEICSTSQYNGKTFSNITKMKNPTASEHTVAQLFIFWTNFEVHCFIIFEIQFWGSGSTLNHVLWCLVGSQRALTWSGMTGNKIWRLHFFIIFGHILGVKMQIYVVT